MTDDPKVPDWMLIHFALRDEQKRQLKVVYDAVYAAGGNVTADDNIDVLRDCAQEITAEILSALRHYDEMVAQVKFASEQRALQDFPAMMESHRTLETAERTP